MSGDCGCGVALWKDFNQVPQIRPDRELLEKVWSGHISSKIFIGGMSSQGMNF
jgi:hypothetical protein